MDKLDIVSMIDDQIRALGESEPLYRPEPYAGNVLVDPIVIAALSHWWNEYKTLITGDGKR